MLNHDIVKKQHNQSGTQRNLQSSTTEPRLWT